MRFKRAIKYHGKYEFIIYISGNNNYSLVVFSTFKTFFDNDYMGDGRAFIWDLHGMKAGLYGPYTPPPDSFQQSAHTLHPPNTLYSACFSQSFQPIRGIHMGTGGGPKMPILLASPMMAPRVHFTPFDPRPIIHIASTLPLQ